MMIPLVLLLSAFFDDFAFKSKLTFEPIPEDGDLFLQQPGDLTIDGQGRIHLLDLSSKTIFVGDKDGGYIGNYGKEGQGPGEFVFSSRIGGPQGYVNAVGEELYIYDGASRSISIFAKDLKYKSSHTFQLESGRAEQFRVIDKDRFLIFYSSYFSEVPFRKVATFKRNKEPITEFKKVKDNTWNYTGDGNNRRVVIHAYTDALTMTYDQTGGRVIIGDSSKPSFEVYDLDGKSQKTVRMALIQKELTQEDRDEWNNMTWFKRQNFFQVSFPDKKAFYNRILPIGDKGYLVYLSSPNDARIDGVVVNGEGRTLGKFKTTCGNGGGLFGSRGRVFAVTTDDDGEFSVNELEFGI